LSATLAATPFGSQHYFGSSAAPGDTHHHIARWA